MLVRSEISVRFMSAINWFFWRAHEGSLSAESDRGIITGLVDSMLRRKLEHSEASPRSAPAQWLAAMHEALVGKSSLDISEHEFKVRFRLNKLSGGLGSAYDDCSLPSVVCAALAGQPHLVALCLEARCAVDAPVRRTELSVNLAKGITALNAVCFFRPLRQLEVLEILLAARADVECQQEMGCRPLHCCTTPGAVDILLRYRADLEARMVPLGYMPLAVAAQFHGNADTVAALIRHGASLEPRPRGVGQSPLGSAAMCVDDTDVVRALLAHRANPNSAAQPHGAIKYFCRALAMYYGRRLRHASPLVRSLAEAEGITPLCFAAMNGKARMVQTLLEARAALDQGNCRGLTAQTLAEREGFPDLFAEIAVASGRLSELASPMDVVAGDVDLEELGIKITIADQFRNI